MKGKSSAYPYMVWMVIFTVIPMLLIIYYSIVDKDGSFTLANFKNVFDPLYLTVIVNSFNLAVLCTIICFILGYPIAYILASREYVNKGFLLFLFIVPMWMNFLLRTYAWLSILENNGIINTLLDMLGFAKKKAAVYG